MKRERPASRAVTRWPYKRPRIYGNTAYANTGFGAMVVPGYTRTGGAYRRSAAARKKAGCTPEKKYLDTTVGSTGISVTGSLVGNGFTVVPLGTGDKERIGNKISVCNFDLKFTFSLDDQTDDTTETVRGNVRAILYVDKQTNGSNAAVTDILTTAAIYSFRNMDTVDRFKILMDRTYNLAPQNAIATAAGDKHIDVGNFGWKKKSVTFKNLLPVYYGGSTGAITEQKSNGIGMILISDLATINYTLNARLKYYDN